MLDTQTQRRSRASSRLKLSFGLHGVTRAVRAQLPVVLVSAALVLGCQSDPVADEGEPDAAVMDDDGGADGAVDTDAAVDEMDASLEQDGERPDDARVPGADADDDAADDGSTHVPPGGSCMRWERDSDGDGEVDTAIAFFYDAEGRLVIEEHDTGSAAGLFDGADGTPDYRQATSYDDDGNVASIADDWDADGNDDVVTRYDSSGRKTEEVWDVEDDGAILDRAAYEYRADGELAAVQRASNGELYSATTYVYDEDGKLVRIEEDQDLSDELADKVSTFEYDDEGRRTREEVYEGMTPASRTTFTYDGGGNLIQKDEDQGIDEVIDATERWTFDGDVLVSHEIDEDGDGLVDESRTFDPEGRVSSARGYHDGVLDVATTFEYDDDGNLVVERAEDGQATLLSRKQRAYDASSRLIELTVDDDGDGTDDIVTRWSYDAHGRLLTVQERRSADPEAPFITTEGYTYDAQGRLIEVMFDSDADGAPDGLERRLYEC